ncbi:hypothetical protein NQ314_005377, partial [Rhamnusium bicolor]
PTAIDNLTNKELQRFVSNNTLKFSERFNISTLFLDYEPSTWASREDYRTASSLICKLKVVNDTAERGVKLMEELNNKITKDANQKQFLLQVVKDYHDVESLVGTIGVGKDFSGVTCGNLSHCVIGDVSLEVTVTQDGFNITWQSNNTETEFKDCFDLKIGKVNWYGGPERKVQIWPLEKMVIDGNDAYILRTTDNIAVAERYWLNSKGAYIFVDERAPLFVDQNNEKPGQVCFISKVSDVYLNRKRNILHYTVILKEDPKQAHLHAINNFLGKPSGYPDEKMIKEPIWTTWAKYKRLINDNSVLSFAQDIRDHKFEAGQLEIDDAWEVSYFIKDKSGSTRGSWWDSNDTQQIDFTNPKAAEWFSARLKKLQVNPGIDSFKFDAGESNYGPQPAVYNNDVDIELAPNILSEDYLRTCSKFGSLVEVRSAWRTQDLPMFVRMLDKDSNWGNSNGLYTLITTLLQMNMNGYTMVLPDMIGGNGYGDPPSAELIIRWTQANTFMPSMQFSYLPWDITSEKFDSVEIVRKFVNLHANYSSKIVEAMNASVKNGSPVNPPIWWIDPTDSLALASDDEFLLGDSILVAPVIIEGAVSRNIYLPKGNWKDGNNGTVYKGPITLKNYSAPIDVLPYFIFNGAGNIAIHFSVKEIFLSLCTMYFIFLIK